MTQQALSALPETATSLSQVQNMGQGSPEDAANLILFLASDDSRHITGADIVIDNGETAR
jgi:3(or 17)beta-hydroxysteroid dehydrogenase|tara:strand:- start:31566 stop:31745 length:180 start_codon:yes stop_codon:yes gene_type:complete